ncbi:TasA family protein [Rossellomorea marisflavi]|uniref:TasA family protein n=1 Tax=Rossellomorea marisflavi TaxID=189381 RepID=UPI003457F9CB
MGIKQKLGLGAASAVLGLSLIGGGTYAYFSDTAEATATFAAGTLDLSVDPTTIINVENIKPGDTMLREFKVVNNGSLSIAQVGLDTSYTVTGKNGEAKDEEFGKHIRVNFLLNASKVDVPIWSTTLYDLQNTTPDVIEGNFFSKMLGKEGIKSGAHDKFYVQYEFVDNGEDQNEFQGNKLNLKWTFEGKQGAGDKR